MPTQSFVAVDLGAESGRTILGMLDEHGLSIEQVTRFPNEMKAVGGHLHWDVDELFTQIKEGLRACGQRSPALRSVGIDTWGVDYGLLDGEGAFVELPYSYRDHRTDGVMEEFFKFIPRRRIYDLTGIQFMKLNSLFQLFAARCQDPSVFQRASKLLFMPDIFNYLLTGVTATEFTFATTSQLFNPSTMSWEPELFEALAVPASLMQPVQSSATMLGRIQTRVADELSLKDIVVTAVASHDTGSAIAAIPAEGDDWAYISSGTWSLMGVELKHPIITEQALSSNFTNEGGIQGTFRFLKNIVGLWLLQQCRKEWSTSVQYTYENLMQMTDAAKPFRSFVDPDYPDFFNPPSMPSAIRKFCGETGQPIPQEHAEFVRCIFESLALKYRSTLDRLRQLTGLNISRIHTIGGGAQNRALCQFTANATGVPVYAGPIEATAIGNIMVQALAMGFVHSLDEMRGIVRRSFKPLWYEPEDPARWEGAYEKYQKLVTTTH